MAIGPNVEGISSIVFRVVNEGLVHVENKSVGGVLLLLR